MNLQWTPDGWADYVYWQTEDRKTLRRINKLIKDMLRTPFQGIGKRNLCAMTCQNTGAAALMMQIASSILSKEMSSSSCNAAHITNNPSRLLMRAASSRMENHRLLSDVLSERIFAESRMHRRTQAARGDEMRGLLHRDIFALASGFVNAERSRSADFAARQIDVFFILRVAENHAALELCFYHHIGFLRFK